MVGINASTAMLLDEKKIGGNYSFQQSDQVTQMLWTVNVDGLAQIQTSSISLA